MQLTMAVIVAASRLSPIAMPIGAVVESDSDLMDISYAAAFAINRRAP